MIAKNCAGCAKSGQKLSACKCGREDVCQCGKDEKSKCKCGVDCQCAGHRAMAGTGMEHKHGQMAFEDPLLKLMDSMMAQMDAVALTGSAERNFLLQMIPHHQGAVEMARYEIEHGKNFEMLQLAKSILAEQQGEIMDMQAMLGNYPAVKSSVNPAYKKVMDSAMEEMMKNTPAEVQLPGDTDCRFATLMLPHHQAAIDMAAGLLQFNPSGPVAIYAQRIIGDQQVEVDQLLDYINKKCGK